jgi:hypothetical protein
MKRGWLTEIVTINVPVVYMVRGVMILMRENPSPEIIDPVFAKTSPKRSFCMTENERFGLVFVKTGSINSGTVL